MKRTYKVTTIAGCEKGFKDGNALESMFNSPKGICISKDGKIYISDDCNNRIRMIHNNQVTTIAGNGEEGFKDGNALESIVYGPHGICISNDDKVYVNDSHYNIIRMIYNNQVTIIAGNGREEDSNFNRPTAICTMEDGIILVSDSGNHRIRTINNNIVVTLAGNGQKGFRDGNALEAAFDTPMGICSSNDGKIYVSDSQNNRVRMIHNNKVITIAGNGKDGNKDGFALEASFGCPSAICCSNDGRRLFVVSWHQIRMIYNNQVTTIAGGDRAGFADGNALEARFYYPTSICCSQDGELYVCDGFGPKIRMIYVDQSSNITKSLFGFALLLDMQNVFCDHQISIHGVAYHIHSAFVRLRCPLLFDQDYLSLIEKANISNKSFDSFITLLYSNSLTKEYNQPLHCPKSIESLIEMIFLFDLLMNCKSILVELKTRFEDELIEMMKNNQQESVRKMMVELLPYMYNMKEMIKTKSNRSKMTEYCCSLLIHELRKKRSIVPLHLSNLQQKISIEAFLDIVGKLIPEEYLLIEPFDDESIFAVELIDLSKLAFEKTNCHHKQKTKPGSSSQNLNLQISTSYLNEWTKPDFVIKLSNDDISYHVHKLILCGRWKYFCSMIESGLKEVDENQMRLSDDWNKSRFENFMKYIYLNEIEFDELEDIVWLMKNRHLYQITETKNQNELINQHEIDDDIAAYGFEALHNYCLKTFRQPLTLSNCISLYLTFEEMGIQSLVEKALNFVSDHFVELITNPVTCQEIRNISNHEKIIPLMFAYLDKNLIMKK